MKDFCYKCDKCRTRKPAGWNGEHWLSPKGWIELSDIATCQVVGHLCDGCNPIKKRKGTDSQQATASEEEK